MASACAARARSANKRRISRCASTNQACPLIFAQSILILPGVIASYFTTSSSEALHNFSTQFSLCSIRIVVHWLMYFLMVVSFTFMYTDITFQRQNLPENLQRNSP
jgi:preprotein translocase subunit SecY